MHVDVAMQERNQRFIAWSDVAKNWTSPTVVAIPNLGCIRRSNGTVSLTTRSLLSSDTARFTSHKVDIEQFAGNDRAYSFGADTMGNERGFFCFPVIITIVIASLTILSPSSE